MAIIIFVWIIVTAILVIASRNPVISSIWLVACFFGQAALFVLMGAHLVAVLQILLYAGAIMVLILFVIMLLNLSPNMLKWKAIAGERIIIGSAVLYLAGVLSMTIWIIYKTQDADALGKVSDIQVMNGTVEGVGNLLLTKYALPFELLSVLLLVAIIGSVVTSKKKA